MVYKQNAICEKGTSLTDCDKAMPYNDKDLGQHGLLPDGRKPLPEPIVKYHQMCYVIFTWEQFQMKRSWICDCGLRF